MRRKLILRFLLAYVLIALCIRALSGTSWILLKGLGMWQIGAAPSLQWTLQDFLDYLGRNMASLLLPGTDVSSLVGLLVSMAILVAGAVLFARGPVKDYHNLCEKAGLLADESVALHGSLNGPDMERRLDAVAARIADAQGDLQAHRADCQAAVLLLDAACAQMEVLVEAGSLAEGSAEARLLQEALAKIRKANGKLGSLCINPKD